MAAMLPEDILVEVFSRVGAVKDLFRLAVTCKRWHRLFTDRDFLRRLWPETDRARLRGLFFHGPRPDPRPAERNDRWVFVPTSQLDSPPVGPEDGDLASFFAPDDRGYHHGGSTPMASRHGVLLSHSVIIRRTCCIRRDDEIHYRLLDPVTGARDDVSPPPDCACAGSACGYAILTASDGAAVFPGDLLLVGDHLDQARFRQHVHAFSAATRHWSAPAQVRHRRRLRMVGSRAAVVHRGAAHWVYADDTVDASVPQSQRHLYLLTASTSSATNGRRVVSASVTKLAIKAAGGVPYLCVSRDSGSRLWLARVHPTRVDVWAQQDGDDGGDVVAWLRAQVFGKEWLLARVIQMPEAAVPAGANFMCCSWFHLRKGTMMAVFGGTGVFVLDLETEAMEMIVDFSGCAASRGFYSCLPYEMDLPEFFLGRLGGRRAEMEMEEQQVALTMGGISSLIFQFIMPGASLFMRDVC
ncbi:unnamed protein product [Urochloa decumbens]|uniref:F-box domain-containing protein n=1 Tax=Urochloa decumbens TaxID=240449 RepID=A0ABC8YZ95_9POAL